MLPPEELKKLGFKPVHYRQTQNYHEIVFPVMSTRDKLIEFKRRFEAPTVKVGEIDRQIFMSILK